jgi:hypothetical protein
VVQREEAAGQSLPLRKRKIAIHSGPDEDLAECKTRDAPQLCCSGSFRRAKLFSRSHDYIGGSVKALDEGLPALRERTTEVAVHAAPRSEKLLRRLTVKFRDDTAA